MKKFTGVFAAFLLVSEEIVLFGKVATEVYIFTVVVALLVSVKVLIDSWQDPGFK